MDFDVAGSAVTYDSCSFAPDSASTATSIATGKKTYSGMINVDITGAAPYETISEKLHKQLGWKIGVISSVNLNHATPAAFYAHQASRNDYYEIGVELAEAAGYKENRTSFEDAMKNVEKLFGLKLSGDENDRLLLTEYEVQRLRASYDLITSAAITITPKSTTSSPRSLK